MVFATWQNGQFALQRVSYDVRDRLVLQAWSSAWCTAIPCCLRSQPHMQWPLAGTLSQTRTDLQARPLLKALGAHEGAVLRLFDDGVGGLVASVAGLQVRPCVWQRLRVPHRLPTCAVQQPMQQPVAAATDRDQHHQTGMLFPQVASATDCTGAAAATSSRQTAGPAGVFHCTILASRDGPHVQALKHRLRALWLSLAFCLMKSVSAH